MANLRLTFVIESLGGGGAQRVLSLLAAELLDLGHHVSVITYADRGPDQIELDPRVERQSASLGGSSRHALEAVSGNVRRVVGLRSMVRESKADVVISFVGTTNILTILACAGLGLPVVISERNDPSRQSLGRVWDLLRRTLYRRAAVVTANSQSAIATMRRYVAEAKLRYIPNPLPPRALMWTPDSNAPFVLAVGRLNAQKGFDVLLNAFAQFTHTYPDWRLVLLGEGPERETLVRQAASLGIAESVDLKGFADPESYYVRCRMFVLPSRFEGMPNALIEAMGYGCPTIATVGLGATQDQALENSGTYIVVPEDSMALAEAMVALAEDDGLAGRLGVAARRAVADLEPRRVALAWCAIFDTVTGADQARPMVK